MASEQSNSSDEKFLSSEAARMSQMVVTVLIFLVGVPLNGLVVWVLGFRRTRGTGVETQGAGSFRLYVVNLALADLVLLLRTPLMLGYLAHHFSWPFGNPVCQLIIFLRCLGLYAGAFLLCAIALERCLCLLRPVWARLRRPRWVVPLVCAVLWVVAAVLATPYITMSGIKEWNNQTQCLESTDTVITLVVMETVIGFLLPLVVFTSCNLAVILWAGRTERGVRTPTTSISSPNSPSGATYPSQRLTRLYRLLMITMLIFLTCWVPYFICRFLKAIASSKGWALFQRRSTYGAYFALFLVYIKSAFNPIMYVFAARGLRRTLRDSLFSTIERIFNDDLSESMRRRSSRRKDSQI